MKTQSLLKRDGSPPDKLIATATLEPPEKATSKQKPKSNFIKYLILLLFVIYLVNMVLR